MIAMAVKGEEIFNEASLGTTIFYKIKDGNVTISYVRSEFYEDISSHKLERCNIATLHIKCNLLRDT